MRAGDLIASSRVFWMRCNGARVMIYELWHIYRYQHSLFRTSFIYSLDLDTQISTTMIRSLLGVCLYSSFSVFWIRIGSGSHRHGHCYFLLVQFLLQIYGTIYFYHFYHHDKGMDGWKEGGICIYISWNLMIVSKASRKQHLFDPFLEIKKRGEKSAGLRCGLCICHCYLGGHPFGWEDCHLRGLEMCQWASEWVSECDMIRLNWIEWKVGIFFVCEVAIYLIWFDVLWYIRWCTYPWVLEAMVWKSSIFYSPLLIVVIIRQVI